MKRSTCGFLKASALTLSLLLASSLTAFAADAKAPAKGLKKIYVVAPNAGDSWGRLGQGFMKACKELGWEGHFNAPVTASNKASIGMVELCEASINAKADVLMVFVQDEALFADVLKRAREKGIYLVALAKPSKDCDLRVGADDANLGQSIAGALVKSMGAKQINVVEMMTDVTSFGQLGQIKPFEEKLAQLAPKAKIVARDDCTSSANAADKLSAIYMAHPDLNCMITVASEAVTGAAAFVADRGIKDKFTIVGFDDTAEVLHAVKDGTLACTVSAQWYDIGYAAVQDVNDVLVNGKKLDYSQSIPAKVIYAQDVDAYAKQYGINMK
jgi:ABC-type sugar transport system substrate-binding protein